jgi:tetratricopeptide (TPR) repeat protein
MASSRKHKWTFTRRFRRHAFGWKTQPAAKRVREAVSEIKKVARKDPVLGGEGSVLFLEKVSAAIEQVDSSSGSMGTAVNNAIEALVPVIAEAPADKALREKWLERLWKAIQEDHMPYIELLSNHWDALSVDPEIASRWANRFAPIALQEGEFSRRSQGYFSAVDVYLGSLLAAGRLDEILDALEFGPDDIRGWRVWGVKALAAKGKVDEAIAYFRVRHDNFSPGYDAARLFEKILLEAGRAEEAYRDHAFAANHKTSNLSTFRAIAKKYPDKEPVEIFRDLVVRFRGEEGKWFATAKSLELFDEAIRLANTSPCDPMTLSRAARDFQDKNPAFALETGLAAIRWLLAGNYYEITGLDIHAAFNNTLGAAKNAGMIEETLARIRGLLTAEASKDVFSKDILRACLRGKWGQVDC